MRARRRELEELGLSAASEPLTARNVRRRGGRARSSARAAVGEDAVRARATQAASSRGGASARRRRWCATIPPIVQNSPLDGSTGKRRLSRPRPPIDFPPHSTPTSARMVRLRTSGSSRRFSLERSRTIPSPIAPPAMLLPEPRGMIAWSFGVRPAHYGRDVLGVARDGDRRRQHLPDPGGLGVDSAGHSRPRERCREILRADRGACSPSGYRAGGSADSIRRMSEGGFASPRSSRSRTCSSTSAARSTAWCWVRRDE